MGNELTTTDKDQQLAVAAKEAALAFGIPADKDEARRLARIAVAYGLDPFLGHVILMGGKPYVTHPGLLHHALRDPNFRGVQAHPLTEEQRQRLGEEIGKGEVWRYAEVKRVLGGETITFSAFAKAGGAFEANPVAKNQANTGYMAEKRAANRALRLAYSVGISSKEEMGLDESAEPAVQLVSCEFSGCTAAMLPEDARRSLKLHQKSLCEEHRPAPGNVTPIPEKPRQKRASRTAEAPPVAAPEPTPAPEPPPAPEGPPPFDGEPEDPDPVATLRSRMNAIYKFDRQAGMAFWKGPPLHGAKLDSLTPDQALAALTAMDEAGV